MSVVMLTKTPLQANMSYIQAGRDRFESGIPAGSVSGLVWADKAGTLYLEESDDDGVTWSQTTNVSVSASTTTVLPWTALTKQQYRFRYVNGAAAQTKFRLVQQARGMELTTVDLSPLENRIDAITSGDTPATAQLTGSNVVLDTKSMHIKTPTSRLIFDEYIDTRSLGPIAKSYVPGKSYGIDHGNPSVIYTIRFLWYIRLCY